MNTLKTFFFLVVLTMLLLMVGAIIGGEIGIIMALGFALLMNFGAYWFSDRIALGMAKAHEVSSIENPELYILVSEQAVRAGLPMPKVYEINSESPNAFATGRNPQNATVAVTAGIRQLLTREELAAVMAHEMAHVGNRDTLIMTVVATIAGAISMLAMIAQFSAIFGGFGGHGRERGGSNIIGLLVVAIVMPLVASVVRLAISRSREFQADRTGALTSGTPEALARALEKLEIGSQVTPMKVAEPASHLFIVNPLRGNTMSKLFSTHPPVAERARRLRGMSEEQV
jgi:heat shock protein HtpX